MENKKRISFCYYLIALIMIILVSGILLTYIGDKTFISANENSDTPNANIADIIAGMFIIFEHTFNTGEIISIDGFRGEVIEIGIRTTKLLDAAGNIKIMNHSDIKNVVNLSREPSLAVVDVDFPYDVPIEFIEKLFDEKFAGLKDKIPGIISGPFYKGVTEYKDSNVTVKIVATCQEVDRFQV